LVDWRRLISCTTTSTILKEIGSNNKGGHLFCKVREFDEISNTRSPATGGGID
jgi:hypothetical protein